ncbi:MAG: hypothetical protein HY526_09525 [Betaproteobacteria bacterium]|nr:hypothetical protein [Betaproteobacteria bacterium]
MGVEIKFTDRDLPVSPGFIEFLHHQIDDRAVDTSWHDQLSETLVPAEFEKRVKRAEAVADRVLRHPLGQKAIYRAYELFTAMLLGTLDKLESVRERYRFICIVGCPRHGGTFLTKHLFSALGVDPAAVPNMIAHDGFPDAAPFRLAPRHNGYTAMMQQTAEYLAMVEVFFANTRPVGGRVVVPKKATKAAYHGAFFLNVWGPDTEVIITLRHPVAACISTYEKSTGLPAGGRFTVRGNIEEWAQRDNVATGADAGRIGERDYFDVYLRYWEQYHYNLALTGLSAARNRTVVVYGRERLMACARGLCERLESPVAIDDFRVFDRRDRHPDWNRRAEPAVRRVAEAWKTVGLDFPMAEVMEAW